MIWWYWIIAGLIYAVVGSVIAIMIGRDSRGKCGDNVGEKQAVFFIAWPIFGVVLLTILPFYAIYELVFLCFNKLFKEK